jgi:hypothetical protein
MILAFYRKNRPKSKELSAFPKSYPLRNRAICAEMHQMLSNAPSQFAKAVAAGDLAAHRKIARVSVVNMHPNQPSDN